MDKYKDEVEKAGKRTLKNENIYRELNEKDLENINLSSNVSVIKTDKDLDIDEIKEIIREKYRSNKDTTKKDEEAYYEQIDEEREITKEYDLKKVIESAHKNKTPDYEKERFKKLQEMQYDILSSLNIEGRKTESSDETLSDEEATLMNLIKTVTVNEKSAKNRNSKSDDLLGDLTGDDNTEVLEPVSFEDEEIPDKKPTIVEEIERTKQLSKTEIADAVKEFENGVDAETSSKDENPKSLSKTEELSNSFYTGSYKISKKDMDDFADLENDLNGGGVAIKILIAILVIIIIAIGIYLLNKYLNLGLF